MNGVGMGEEYDNILDELLGGILETEYVIADTNQDRMGRVLGLLGREESEETPSVETATEPGGTDLHITVEEEPSAGDYTTTGGLRYDYSITMMVEDEEMLGEISTNMDWLQDRLTASGTSKFVFENLPESVKQGVRSTGQLEMDETLCAEWNQKINVMRRGVTSGIPISHLKVVATYQGWNRLETEVQDWEQAVATGEATTWGETTANESDTPGSTPRRTREATPSRGNAYGLAWEIYSLGYSTGDVAHLYKTSAGSISRGLKKDGRLMRTGAETRAMTKTEPDNFSVAMVDSIRQLLADKYETEEERNGAFYRAFNKNLYEITIYEAEDEQEHIEQMHQEATTQGISLNDLARQQITEQAYVERERSEFVNKLKDLHEELTNQLKAVFGDVNVGVGAVNVQTKLKYANGVVLTVKDAYKIDGKALDVANAVVSVNVAEYIATTYERGVEVIAQNFNRLVRSRFTKGGEQLGISQLGNRMVVGLDNE